MSPIPTPKIKLVGGLFIPATDPGSWLIRNGMVNDYPAYQYDRLEAAVGFCKQRRTAIDGGAHIGSWSVHLASMFDHVKAFEPVPDNAGCFALNLSSKKNVMLYRAALGSQNRRIHVSNKGGKSVSWAPVAESDASETDLSVPCLTLDSLMLRNVDLIKLDVEGYELEALKGASTTIMTCRPVIVIEEKHDLEFKATQALLDIGMKLRAQMKHDRIFTWE